MTEREEAIRGKEITIKHEEGGENTGIVISADKEIGIFVVDKRNIMSNTIGLTKAMEEKRKKGYTGTYEDHFDWILDAIEKSIASKDFPVDMSAFEKIYLTDRAKEASGKGDFLTGLLKAMAGGLTSPDRLDPIKEIAKNMGSCADCDSDSCENSPAYKK